MTVYCNSSLSSDYGVRDEYIRDYLSGLLYHFQTLNFGEGVKEVVYFMAGGSKEYLSYIGVGTVYSKKIKSIGCGFYLDFEISKKMEIEELLPYVSFQLIEESKKFSQLRIRDFDLEDFVKGLELYFSEALKLMKDGKKPGEGKVLNDEIQISMAKKWSKL